MPGIMFRKYFFAIFVISKQYVERSNTMEVKDVFELRKQAK